MWLLFLRLNTEIKTYFAYGILISISCTFLFAKSPNTKPTCFLSGRTPLLYSTLLSSFRLFCTRIENVNFKSEMCLGIEHLWQCVFHFNRSLTTHPPTCLCCLQFYFNLFCSGGKSFDASRVKTDQKKKKREQQQQHRKKWGTARAFLLCTK